MPYLCHSRNHGLWANVSSCLRFAAEMSLALSGLMSGASNISCSCSMSSIMRSTSIPSQYLTERRGGQSVCHLHLWNSPRLRISYSHSKMTSDERMQRESSLIATIRKQLPDFAKACADDTELVLLH